MVSPGLHIQVKKPHSTLKSTNITYSGLFGLLGDTARDQRDMRQFPPPNRHLVADIARWGARQPRDGKLLHIFGHVLGKKKRRQTIMHAAAITRPGASN